MLVGRLTAFRFLARSSYLQAHRAWPRSGYYPPRRVFLVTCPRHCWQGVVLLPRHGFPHYRQKDYLSASGWGEGKLFTVSGFEPDPTSIVSPSSFVALPLGAFLRQAVLRATGVAMTCYSPNTPISPLICASSVTLCRLWPVTQHHLAQA